MKLLLAAAAVMIVASPALAQGGNTMGGMSGMQGMSGTQGMSGMQGMGQGSMMMARGDGVITAVDPKAGTVTIRHGAIAALKLPTGTDTYKASAPSVLQGVTAGENVAFQLMQLGGSITVTAIHPK